MKLLPANLQSMGKSRGCLDDIHFALGSEFLHIWMESYFNQSQSINQKSMGKNLLLNRRLSICLQEKV
uniref:Uncharacterized protein n=1 Tax=Tetranychus urticae TaxID=32264 RepID=T1K1M2_TETUR